jgi:hypothetical protein
VVLTLIVAVGVLTALVPLARARARRRRLAGEIQGKTQTLVSLDANRLRRARRLP